jgi:hypothetical protein
MILIQAGYVRISRGRGTFVIPPEERGHENVRDG